MPAALAALVSGKAPKVAANSRKRACPAALSLKQASSSEDDEEDEEDDVDVDDTDDDDNNDDDDDDENDDDSARSAAKTVRLPAAKRVRTAKGAVGKVAVGAAAALVDGAPLTKRQLNQQQQLAPVARVQQFVASLSAEERELMREEGAAIPGPGEAVTKAHESFLKKLRRKVKNKLSAKDSRRRRKEQLDGLVAANQQLAAQLHSMQALLRPAMPPMAAAARGPGGAGASSTGTTTMVLLLLMCTANGTAGAVPVGTPALELFPGAPVTTATSTSTSTSASSTSATSVSPVSATPLTPLQGGILRDALVTAGLGPRSGLSVDGLTLAYAPSSCVAGGSLAHSCGGGSSRSSQGSLAPLAAPPIAFLPSSFQFGAGDNAIRPLLF
jgi:hypothetical protein